MFGALTVDQGELDDLSFGRGQNWVRFAINRTANSEVDHFSFSDSRAQCVLRIRLVNGIVTRFGLRRGSHGGGWSGIVLRSCVGRG
jgi:hypothetical protein